MPVRPPVPAAARGPVRLELDWDALEIAVERNSPDTDSYLDLTTGRVITISKAIENDEDQTIRQYDKVLFDPREAIPVELEHDNRLFVVSIDRVLAIFRRSDPKVGQKPAAEDE